MKTCPIIPVMHPANHSIMARIRALFCSDKNTILMHFVLGRWVHGHVLPTFLFSFLFSGKNHRPIADFLVAIAGGSVPGGFIAVTVVLGLVLSCHRRHTVGKVPSREDPPSAGPMAVFSMRALALTDPARLLPVFPQAAAGHLRRGGNAWCLGSFGRAQARQASLLARKGNPSGICTVMPPLLVFNGDGPVHASCNDWAPNVHYCPKQAPNVAFCSKLWNPLFKTRAPMLALAGWCKPNSGMQCKPKKKHSSHENQTS